jgi:hypothetical protein
MTREPYWIQLEQKADASNETGARHINLGDISTVRFKRDSMNTEKFIMAEAKMYDDKLILVWDGEVADRFMRHWLTYLGDKLPEERIDPRGKAGLVYLPDSARR